MSAFAEKDFDAKGYSNNRPSYPDSFYKLLDQYHLGPRNLLIDVGCGPGTATFQMAEKLSSFRQIIGTDISATMVDRARSRKAEHPENYSRVSFEVSPADDFSFLKNRDANQQNCDFVTAVQCVHWLDFEKFQKAVATVLRKNGTLAVWGNADPIFPDYPKVDSVLAEFTYGQKYLGPYWDPGRQILRNLLKDYQMDKTLFTDFKEACLDGNFIRSEPNNPLLVAKTLTLASVQAYVRTWSSYHFWRKKNPGAKKDISEQFADQVLQLYPQMTKDTRLQVVWKSFYKLSRRL